MLLFCVQIGCNPGEEGIFKVNAVNRDNPGGEALQEDFRRQTLQNFHNKLFHKTGRRQHTFCVLTINNLAGKPNKTLFSKHHDTLEISQ